MFMLHINARRGLAPNPARERVVPPATGRAGIVPMEAFA